MPKKERDLVLWILKNFVNSLMPRRFKGELKGSDHFGNKYYELEAGGNRSKMSRYFEPIGKDDGFDAELPAEWESWLRGRRKHPPTEEEVKASYKLMLEKKKKAKEIEAKYKVPQDDTSLMPTGRKNFPVYPEYEESPGQPSKKL